MAAKTRERKSVDERLVQVVAHPQRVQALSILAERVASPKELAAELGSPVGNISYHVRELEDAGMIELVEEKKRRGAIEHFYRAISGPNVDTDEWETLDSDGRMRVSAWIIQLVLADASQALTAGTFDARDDRHLSRTPLLVDEQGWAELVEIQANTLRAVLKVRAANAARLEAADGKEGIPTVAATMCFEMPPKRRSPDPA